jgi:hypothetical protein
MVRGNGSIDRTRGDAARYRRLDLGDIQPFQKVFAYS